MPNTPEPSARATAQALEWLVLLEAQPTAAQQQAFRAWLARDPTHAQAWQQAQAFMAGLDHLPAADLADILALSPPPAVPKRRHPRRRSLLALAATLCLAVGIWRSQPAWYADQHTRIGEQRQLTLADGSSVELNTDSALSVDFSPQRRRVYLHQGEAYFNVAADAARPFEVATPNGSTRALGTAFNVRIDAGLTRVTVYQHAVAVALGNGATLPRLGQGKQIQFSSDSLGTVQSAELARVDAWRRRQLVFEDRPLAEVVHELNRYRPGWIAIVDAAAAEQRVTGIIDTRAPDQALQSLIESLPIHSQRIAHRWVLLYARRP